MWKFIWGFIKDHTKPFWTGFVGSGIVWGNILFADVGPVSGVVVAYLLRLSGAVLIAFGSGVATSLAADFYKEIKERYKNRKNGKRKKDDQSEAA